VIPGATAEYLLYTAKEESWSVQSAPCAAQRRGGDTVLYRSIVISRPSANSLVVSFYVCMCLCMAAVAQSSASGICASTASASGMTRKNLTRTRLGRNHGETKP
jgi:hypothetical protein